MDEGPEMPAVAGSRLISMRFFFACGKKNK